MYDVRFITDSIFERTIRTAHLGVMVGFSVVVTQFDPNNQQNNAFKTMSLILMISRIVLVVQYCVTLWHIRRYRQGRYPIAIAASIHFVSAIVYLGISFTFTENTNSRVYLIWYVGSAIEALLQIGLAMYFNVLSFTGTHLTERMTVLTIIILGGGVTKIAQNIVLIVVNANGWSK
jgi:low temperature requirement protein LtrA